MKSIFENRLLLTILVPVVGTGILFSILLNRFLAPPLISQLKSRAEATLKHASEMGISVCEERFSDLLELRLENDPELNAASRKEAIDQIKMISKIHPDVHMLVIAKDRTILGSSIEMPRKQIQLPHFNKTQKDVLKMNIGGEPIRIHYRYFPFWRWFVVSLIPEKDFMAPIMQATWIVRLGTFGMLMVVMIVTLFLFIWRVNRPLKQIIKATEVVAEGKLTPVEVKSKDEIGKVALAFNHMVQSLLEDNQQLESIMSALRDSEEQYRILTEHSLAHIAMVNRDRFAFTNKMMLKTLSCSFEWLKDKPFWQILHPEDRNWVQNRLTSLLDGELKADHFECRYETFHGKAGWFEILATLILYQEKNALLIHAIDISARKSEQNERLKLEKRLSRAQKMEAIGTLAGGVAHDLNNILSGLVSYPELLLLEIADDSPLREPILTIKKSGERAAAIVQDLLTLSRRGVTVTEVIDLNHIVMEHLSSPEHADLKAFHPDVQIDSRLEEGLLPILGSPVHISKTLMNLISNAAEAMPFGGSLTITTENCYIDNPVKGYDDVAEGDYATLTVSDTGIGIASEDMGRIFEPFYTKKVMGKSGTGLGMAVVWGTVKDHNGYIDVRSTEDRGTSFTLYFQVTRKRAPEAIAEISMEDYKGSGESILIVDDVEEQRIIASKMLKNLGYTVDAVSSGEEAEDYVEKTAIDLLVLDMIMDPGIDGMETYKRISALHPGQKAIIASGFSETDRIREAQRMGAGQYVKKPYTLEKIGMAVRMELDKAV